jgi:hypothetical protein
LDGQLAPFASFGAQLPLLQKSVATQVESSAHDVGHVLLLPSQRYGAHDGLPAAPAPAFEHTPVAHVLHAALHASLQQKPPAQ